MTLDRLTPTDVEELIQDRLKGSFERMLALGSVNLDHIHHFGPSAGHHMRTQDSVAWLMLIDGAPVARRARQLTGASWPRLSGSDLLPGILSVAERTGARVGFLGGHQGTAEALEKRLTKDWPHLEFAGSWTPSRSAVDHYRSSQELAQAIRAAKVDLLAVGLGKPRQEVWINTHGPTCGAHVTLAFGAAADFLAGSARRAPQYLRNAGMEWLFRLAQEPGRLSRRYLIQGPAALYTLRRAEAVVSHCEARLVAASSSTLALGSHS